MPIYHGGIESAIASFVEKTIKELLKELGTTISPRPFRVEIEIPKEKSHGDLSTNVALRLAKLAGRDPVNFANLVKERLEKHLASFSFKAEIEGLDVKGPGFINFFFSKDHLYRTLLEICRKKSSFGASSFGRGTKLLIEFVSANPTGPLTIAHARQAAVGDSLANILEYVGYRVKREYYINDEGTQMNILGNSIRIRYLELCGAGTEPFPEDGYKGTYVVEIAEDFRKKYGTKYSHTTDLKVYTDFGLKWVMADIKKDLKDFGVAFDTWYSQRKLAKSGNIEKTLKSLRQKGYIYDKDGAVWFKSQAFGDDKDRVVIKSDGAKTYLAPDIAYHLDKYKRGYKRLIDIWGPDHHGYIPRMKAAVKALGYPQESLDVLIVQLATLYKAGNVLSMSTRAGQFITLREVMDEVGKDAARFGFLMRRLSSHLDFDLETVKLQSQENPVYYIQYAHARIWSILGYAKKARLSAKFDSASLKEPEEMELLRAMRRFPFVVLTSAKTMEPCMVLQYLQELATIFHSFYTKHRVVSDDPAMTRARLILVDSVRVILANGLKLLGVTLPKKM